MKQKGRVSTSSVNITIKRNKGKGLATVTDSLWHSIYRK
jgi:hypothetical protein